MLAFVEIVFSSIGVYGFFSGNWICAIIGLVCIVICDFIDIFISGHNPTTIILACLFAIGFSIADKSLLYGFTIALCGENLIMSIITIFIIGLSFLIGYFKKDKSTKIRNDLMKYFDYDKFSDLEKYVELSNIVMEGLEVKTLDEAIEKTYAFYKKQRLEVEKVQIDESNKFKTLSELVMLGLDTDSIDEAIERTKEFYDSQENKEENEVN